VAAISLSQLQVKVVVAAEVQITDDVV